MSIKGYQTGLLRQALLRGLFAASALLVIVLPTSLRAEEEKPFSLKEWVIKVRAAGSPECTCRAQGQSFTVGTTICMGNSVFRCSMDQNVTSWQALREPCPQS